MSGTFIENLDEFMKTPEAITSFYPIDKLINNHMLKLWTLSDFITKVVKDT